MSLSTTIAEVSGDFTYTDDGLAITITSYSANPIGHAVIPDVIAGKPVIAIGPYAFGEGNPISVAIPASVTTIGNLPFPGSRLATISVAASNPSFSSQDGILFNKLKTSLIRFPSAKTGTYAIPAGVTHIESLAFYYCTGLTQVTIPHGVASLGRYAFGACSKLTGISIPPSVTSMGDSVFARCYGLSSVVLPASLSAIEPYTFSDCRNLTTVTIPSPATRIGDSAFYNCSGLTSVTIPPTVVEIGRQAFGLCTGLKTVTIPEGVVTLGDYAFGSCRGMTGITLPASLNGIGRFAFTDCVKLIGVNIPSGVTSIGDNAFTESSGITFFTVDPANPGFSGVGGVLFNKSKTLLICYPPAVRGHYNVPPGTMNIGLRAFYNCDGLESMTFPSGLTGIGDYAFGDCGGLKTLTLPPGLTGVGKYAFAYCRGLREMTLPQGLTVIGRAAFQGCAGLKSTIIPSSVTHLGEFAFAYCSGLESVSILSNAPAFGFMAFDDCMMLRRMAFAGNAPTVDTDLAKSPLPLLTIYHFSSKTGFTSPTWFGYPTVNMGTSNPTAYWLVSKAVPFDANLSNDANSDGVNLLMAYALNLDPNKDLSGSLPQPVFTAGEMSLSFYAGTAGVAYTVEASGDMVDWSTNGVTLSGPDASQIRTATVERTGPLRFMRLGVSH